MVDLPTAKEVGLPVLRVPAYSPYAVAEHAAGLMMTLNRKYHRAYNRTREFNFNLQGLLGFDLHGKTVGVIGTGKIGVLFGKICLGFGCNVIAHDVYESDEAKALGIKYVTLDQLLETSDIISLHCPLFPTTKYMINEYTIRQMKKGVMLINTSRGGLLNTTAILQGLKTGHIGSLALDVFEGENDIFYEDHSGEILADEQFTKLFTFPNVLITGHQAYFTKEALDNIAKTTFDNAEAVLTNGPYVNEVKNSLPENPQLFAYTNALLHRVTGRYLPASVVGDGATQVSEIAHIQTGRELLLAVQSIQELSKQFHQVAQLVLAHRKELGKVLLKLETTYLAVFEKVLEESLRFYYKYRQEHAEERHHQRKTTLALNTKVEELEETIRVLTHHIEAKEILLKSHRVQIHDLEFQKKQVQMDVQNRVLEHHYAEVWDVKAMRKRWQAAVASEWQLPLVLQQFLTHLPRTVMAFKYYTLPATMDRVEAVYDAKLLADCHDEGDGVGYEPLHQFVTSHFLRIFSGRQKAEVELYRLLISVKALYRGSSMLCMFARFMQFLHPPSTSAESDPTSPSPCKGSKPIDPHDDVKASMSKVEMGQIGLPKRCRAISDATGQRLTVRASMRQSMLALSADSTASPDKQSSDDGVSRREIPVVVVNVYLVLELIMDVLQLRNKELDDDLTAMFVSVYSDHHTTKAFSISIQAFVNVCTHHGLVSLVASDRLQSPFEVGATFEPHKPKHNELIMSSSGTSSSSHSPVKKKKSKASSNKPPPLNVLDSISEDPPSTLEANQPTTTTTTKVRLSKTQATDGQPQPPSPPRTNNDPSCDSPLTRGDRSTDSVDKKPSTTDTSDVIEEHIQEIVSPRSTLLEASFDDDTEEIQEEINLLLDFV
ncbi:hypothetical protein DYB36_000049 [Aphanomyces astaci]|uniref:D-isomer specific 2-hydroxyacid dehydrogenase NAD-binding domain-containing protein n=1 Tax=Aphanomyces astaci TaxID=112090 RepID=A0A397ETK0_APHAT|nr:hypothetical protein DYB36_000049 [Aphanomyces astaci]RHZ04737.1 hypothetical protein DYB31_000054 [Aphanomyces astaci]